MLPTTDAVPLDDVELPFLDITSDEYFQDPFAAVEALRRTDPRGARLVRTVRGVDLMRYDAGKALLTDKRILNPDVTHFAEMGAGPLLVEYLSNGKMNAMRGQQHLAHRKLLTPPLSPGTVAAQRRTYREIADELIDGLAAGRCDLVADFSHSYPVRILCRALGVPVTDIHVFERMTLEFALINSFPLEPYVPRIEAALQALVDYVSELIERRTAVPGGEFVDELVGYERDGRMTKKEIVWSLVTLMQAAHFTTRNQTVSIVRALLETGLWDAVAANRSLIPAAVEEGMRYYPVVLGVTRVVGGEGVVFDDVELPVGTLVRWNPMGATRDPGFFDQPYRFDLARDTRGRIPFGWGLHKCLGHTMARADMEVAVEALTERLVSPVIETPPRMVATGSLWGAEALRLRFDT